MNNNVNLDLKLGQTATEEQDYNGGVRQPTYMANYTMFGGQGQNLVEFNNSSLGYWQNVQSGPVNYLVYQAGPSLQTMQCHSPKRPNRNTGRVCKSCGSSDTPLWRKGPDGPQTLCNACGLKYLRVAKKGKE